MEQITPFFLHTAYIDSLYHLVKSRVITQLSESACKFVRINFRSTGQTIFQCVIDDIIAPFFGIVK